MMALREYVDTGPVGRRRLPRLTRADLEGMDAEVDESSDDDEEETEVEAEIEAEPVEHATVDLDILDA